MRFTLALIAGVLFFFVPSFASASSVADSNSGKILLQVERNGEAWYIFPTNKLRYYLGNPSDAFSIMRELGLGITNADLAKIPTSGSNDQGDLALRQRLSGRIVLQVEKNGEAWYVYPGDLKRYYMGRPADAFSLMRNLGLGADNESINQVEPDRLFRPNQFHVSEGGYAFVFYGLIGNGDTGSWSFTPWGSQSQPFEYSLFSRSLPYGGGNVIYIGEMAGPEPSWRYSPGPWFSTRTTEKLAAHDWDGFVNSYLDDWFHQKNSDGVEIFNHGDPKFPFKVSDVKRFTIQGHTASIMTVQTSAYQNFYIRNKVILVTKDYQKVYYLWYQTWTQSAHDDASLDLNIADFERMARTFKVL